MDESTSVARSRTADYFQVSSLLLRALIEAGVLGLVVLSPWLFGSIEPEFESLLYFGLAILLVLWSMRTLLDLRLQWATCPVILCLAGIIVFGVLQLVPLPPRLLATLSPTTAQLRRELLPAQPEVLPFDEPHLQDRDVSSSAISLYPAGTKFTLMRVLAVLLLFALVRNNLCSISSLRRLSVATLVNGALLAILGLLQFFSSAHNTVYWTFPSIGQVFGPFINRNHFAFYLNLCIGLGAGLLFFSYGRSDVGGQVLFRQNQRKVARSSVLFPQDSSDGSGVLWIGAALALMVASNVMTVSRGGLLAMFVAAVSCLGLATKRFSHSLRWKAALLVLLCSLGLVVWFGIDRVTQRLNTIWSGQAFVESRQTLWLDTLPWIPKCGLLGTGYGTFEHVEPLHRTSPVAVVYEHAHNEYLEALIEGGLPRLVLTLLGLSLTAWLGLKSLNNYGDRPERFLILGALFAFIAAVVHSFGEFAIHIPAVTFLATVIAAMLCSFCALPEHSDQSGATEAPHSGTVSRNHAGKSLPTSVPSRSPWLARLLACYGATCGFIMAFVLGTHGWDFVTVQRYRRASWNLSNAEQPDRLREIAFLQAAANRAPDHARLQIELARLHLDTFDELNSKFKDVDDDNPEIIEAREKIAREHFIPALQRYILARDLCPLLPQPHYQIGANVDVFAAAESRASYLARVKLLAPTDAESWYLCGLQELLDEQWEEAWKSWRRSLELSDAFLVNILDEAVSHLESADIVAKLLPNQPQVLLQVALHLYPQPAAVTERQIFLEKAVELFDRQPQPLSALDWCIKARLYFLLNQPQAALAAYAAALAEEPGQADWRYELAKLHYDQGHFQDARRELTIVLGQYPNHGAAKSLMEDVAQAIASGKDRRAQP